MTDHASAPAGGWGWGALSLDHSVKSPTLIPGQPALQLRAASADTSSWISAFARASAQKKSSSLAVARQFTGVMMIAANWQAQCSVAASQRLVSAVTR